MRRRRLDTYSDLLPAERRQQARSAALSRRLAAEEALCDPEGWVAFVEARQRFPYSWRNCALIAYQRPGACALQTFAQWRGTGFHVAEGQHAVRIVMPPSGGRGFRDLKLFDVDQTDAPLDFLTDDERNVDVGELVGQVPAPATVDDVPAAVQALERAMAVAA